MSRAQKTRKHQRRESLHFLDNDRPAWKAEDHPGLGAGAEAWVRQLRQQRESRHTEEENVGRG